MVNSVMFVAVCFPPLVLVYEEMTNVFYTCILLHFVSILVDYLLLDHGASTNLGPLQHHTSFPNTYLTSQIPL